MPGYLTVADAAIAIGGDLTGFDKSLQVAGAKSQTLGEKLKSVFSPRNIMPGIGAAAGLGFMAANDAAIAFEDQLRTINTVAKLTDDQLFKMGDGIQALSRETGKTTTDLTAGFYDLVSAGVPAAEALQVLKDSAILATGALGTTEQAVDLVTSVLGAYGKAASESGRSTDIWAQAVADGKTTVADLQQSIGSLAPIAAEAGIKEEELAAATALVTLTGSSASEAMTQMRRALAALLTPNEKLNAVQEQTGINFAALAKERGLAVSLEALRQALGNDTTAFAEVLGSSEALNFGLQVTGENAGAMATELDRVTTAADTGGVALGQYTEKSKSGAEQGKRLSAWLNTVAQDFGGVFSAAGPAIYMIGSMGPMVSRTIGAGLGGLAGILIPRVTAAVLATGPGAAIAGSGVGGMIGTAMGAAIPVALVAAAGVGIALAFKAIVLDPGLQQQSRDIGKAVGEEIANGTLEQLQQSKGALEKGIADINALPLGGFLYGDQVRDLQTQLDAVNAALLAGGKEMPESLAAGIEQTTPTVEIAVADLVKTLGTSMAGVKAAAKITGAEGMAAMAAGITAARQAPLDAFDTLKSMLKNAMTPMGEIARLHGELTSKALARGLRSGDPAVRAQAIAVAKAAAARLAELAAGGGKAGKAAMAELDKGIRSKIPAVRAASIAAKATVVDELEATKKPAAAAGRSAARAFADALTSGVRTAIAALPGDTAAELNAGRREAPKNPRRENYALGTTYVPRDMLAQIHRGEIIVPRAESDAIRSGRASLGAGGVTVNVYNPAPEPASTSTRRELRKLALSGSAL